LVSYSAGLGWAPLRRKARWSLAVWALLAGAILLTIQLPLVSLGIAFLLTSVIHYTIRLSLRDFPYSEKERRALKLLPVKEPERIDLRWLGAPAVLQKWRLDLNPLDALLIGASVGWAIFCASFHNLDDDRTGTQMLAHGYLTVLLLLNRLWSYVTGHLPPVSLAGRVATGRFIIPSYDIVFAAPALAIIGWLALPIALIGIGVWPFIAWPITTAVTTAILLGAPPRYETWHFTGHFRETVGSVDKRRFIQA
jgi:hypothetical protein